MKSNQDPHHLLQILMVASFAWMVEVYSHAWLHEQYLHCYFLHHSHCCDTTRHCHLKPGTLHCMIYSSRLALLHLDTLVYCESQIQWETSLLERLQIRRQSRLLSLFSPDPSLWLRITIHIRWIMHAKFYWCFLPSTHNNFHCLVINEWQALLFHNFWLVFSNQESHTARFQIHLSFFLISGTADI